MKNMILILLVLISYKGMSQETTALYGESDIIRSDGKLYGWGEGYNSLKGIRSASPTTTINPYSPSSHELIEYSEYDHIRDRINYINRDRVITRYEEYNHILDRLEVKDNSGRVIEYYKYNKIKGRSELRKAGW